MEKNIREAQSIGFETNKIKLSISEEEMFRYRSQSCRIPDIEVIAYSLAFVPKLKPRKHEHLPSPMNLNAKSLKNFKKNRQSKFMIETDNYFLSCPEKDDIESTDENKSNSKFMEEEKFITYVKPLSKESDSILNVKKENKSSIIERFSMDFADMEDLNLKKYKKSVTKKFSVEIDNEFEDEYLKLKSTSFINNGEKKIRAFSILRMLEINIDERRKLTSCDAY